MNEATNKLIPELRFPEFVNEGEWVENEIGKLFKFKQGVQVSVENQYLTKKNGMVRFIRIIDITSNSEAPRYIENPGEDHLIEKNDLFMIRYGTPGAISIGFDGVIANNLFRLIWKIDKHFDAKYWFYSFQKMGKIIYTLSGSSSMPAISFSTLDNLNINYPKNPYEQQKIASCLSSLDELIAAENQKLEALKTHKKGMMQQLFPAQGETVPKLRFAEFRNSGEWEENVLGGKGFSIFVKERTTQIKLKLETYISTENLLADYGEVTIASKLPPAGSFTRFQKGDILISNIRPYLKKVWYANFNGAASNDVLVIRAGNLVNETFLSFQLKNDAFINYVMMGAKGVKMPRGDKSLMEEYPIKFSTKEEQLKIASCLSSLDELIAAQSQKIEALKVHKKGLMQGLFPMAEV